MTKQNLLIVTLLTFLSFGLFSKAQQPELSYWTKNISEGQEAPALGFYDFAHEMVISGTTVHCLWIADSAYHYKLFYRRSTDNGNTWGGSKLLAKGMYPYFPTPFTSKRMTVEGRYGSHRLSGTSYRSEC